MHSDPVERVLAFLNTIDVEEDTDVMSDLSQWRAWVHASLGGDGEAETTRSLDDAHALRTHLRTVVTGEPPGDRPSVPVTVEFEADGPRLAADTVTGTIAAAVAQLTIERRWERIKICPADDCRWAFYDASRNHSRQWCSMRVCGNRAKVRRHRDRIG